MIDEVSLACPSCGLTRLGVEYYATWCPKCDELMRPVLGPFRDGKIHVLDGKCKTCIFRSGNLMHLTEGTVETMVASALAENTVIACHSTLNGPRSVCRGFYDLHKANVMPLRLAQAMNTLAFDSQPEES